MGTTIYKVLTREQWDAAQRGAPVQAPVDERDGYVHFSTQATLQGTLDKWFQGAAGAVLLSFDSDDFGDSLKWEPARGGELFPHVYARVDAARAQDVRQLEMDSNGRLLASPSLSPPKV